MKKPNVLRGTPEFMLLKHRLLLVKLGLWKRPHLHQRADAVTQYMLEVIAKAILYLLAVSLKVLLVPVWLVLHAFNMLTLYFRVRQEQEIHDYMDWLSTTEEGLRVEEEHRHELRTEALDEEA